MRRFQAFVASGIGAVLMAGCHQPYFMTEQDYAYHNRVAHELPPSDYVADPVSTTTPRSVRDLTGSRWELSLADAIRIATENNKGIIARSYEPGEAGTDIERRLASFDTVFEAGGAWERIDRQLSGGGITTVDGFRSLGRAGATVSTTSGAAADDPASGTPRIPGTTANVLSLAKRNATGGATTVSYGLDYDFGAIPIGGIIAVPVVLPWTSAVEFHIEQPLLQGAGVEFNRRPILIARATHEQRIREFQTAVHDLVRDVELEYWQLYFTYQDLYSRETGMQQALSTWQKEKRRLEVGQGAVPDVAQAREQYEFFRAERIQALDRVLEREQRLRNLLGLPPDDGRQIVPKDNASTAEFKPHWATAVMEGMDLRPELEGQRYAVRAAEMELLQQKNGLSPDLTVGGSWVLSGLGDEFDSSIDILTDNRFADWFLGVRYVQPIGERAANASVQRARLALSRQRAILRQREHDVLHELHSAHRDLITSYELIGAQQDRRDAAAIQLAAREQFYRQGKTTIDVLLEAQTAFADALRDESAAVVRYNQALTQWERAKGTLLGHDNILLAEEHLGPVRRPANRWARCNWLWHWLGDDYPEIISEKTHGPLYPEGLLPMPAKSDEAEGPDGAQAPGGTSDPAAAPWMPPSPASGSDAGWMAPVGAVEVMPGPEEDSATGPLLEPIPPTSPLDLSETPKQ